MGYAVSSVVANLVMENIETRALETFADPPRLWKRYEDDTFVIMKRSKLSEFLTHLNTIERSIQFTMEKEKEGCLPFLDLLIKRSASGHLLSAVYRKPTHSDRSSTLDQNTLYSISNQSLTLSSNELKNFPPQPRT